MGPSLAPTQKPSTSTLLLRATPSGSPAWGQCRTTTALKARYRSRLTHAVCPSFWRPPVHFCTRCIKTHTGDSTFRQAATGTKAIPMKCITNGLKEHIPLSHWSKWQLGTCLQQPGEILHSPVRTPQRQHLILWLLSRVFHSAAHST